MNPLELENEKKEIINKYRTLLRSCPSKTSKSDKKLIRKATRTDLIFGSNSQLRACLNLQFVN